MLKLLGSVCILLAGAAVRRLQVRSIRRELAALEGVTAGLRELGDRIRLSRMPLPRLLGRVGENRERDARTFFQTAEETILGGQPPSEAWRRAAELLPVGARPPAGARGRGGGGGSRQGSGEGGRGNRRRPGHEPGGLGRPLQAEHGRRPGIDKPAVAQAGREHVLERFATESGKGLSRFGQDRFDAGPPGHPGSDGRQGAKAYQPGIAVPHQDGPGQVLQCKISGQIPAIILQADPLLQAVAQIAAAGKRRGMDLMSAGPKHPGQRAKNPGALKRAMDTDKGGHSSSFSGTSRDHSSEFGKIRDEAIAMSSEKQLHEKYNIRASGNTTIINCHAN